MPDPCVDLRNMKIYKNLCKFLSPDARTQSRGTKDKESESILAFLCNEHQYMKE
jgi:hypothetical protein